MTFLQQERDTDFFENYNHSGKRVVAKALSDKEGPSSIWSWRTIPMCDSQNTELESGDSNSNDYRFHSNPHEFSHQTS